MEEAKKTAPSVVLVVVEIILGVLLLINPEFFTKLAVIVIGVILIFFGIVFLVRYFKERNEPDSNSGGTLAIAIIALALGIICTFFSWWIIGLFGVMAVFIGIILIITGILKITTYSDNKKQGLPVSAMTIVGAVISIILGIIIIINPFSAVNVLWIFAGIALIVAGILDLIAIISGRKSLEQ